MYYSLVLKKKEIFSVTEFCPFWHILVPSPVDWRQLCTYTYPDHSVCQFSKATVKIQVFKVGENYWLKFEKEHIFLVYFPFQQLRKIKYKGNHSIDFNKIDSNILQIEKQNKSVPCNLNF